MEPYSPFCDTPDDDDDDDYELPISNHVVSYDVFHSPSRCPGCGRQMLAYHSKSGVPFYEEDPIVGLQVWGPESAYKDPICIGDGFIHFAFADGEDRLVLMPTRGDEVDDGRD